MKDVRIKPRNKPVLNVDCLGVKTPYLKGYSFIITLRILRKFLWSYQFLSHQEGCHHKVRVFEPKIPRWPKFGKILLRRLLELATPQADTLNFLDQYESSLTLRRPGRQAWRPGLFYGAPSSHLQVISKRRKMTPLEIKFSFFFNNKPCCLRSMALTQ